MVKKKKESFCSGLGGSATGHRSYLLTLPVLAAQSPPGGGPEQGMRTCFVMSGETLRGGVVVMQSHSRAESGEAGRRACTFEAAVPSHHLSVRVGQI